MQHGALATHLLERLMPCATGLAEDLFLRGSITILQRSKRAAPETAMRHVLIAETPLRRACGVTLGANGLP